MRETDRMTRMHGDDISRVSLAAPRGFASMGRRTLLAGAAGLAAAGGLILPGRALGQQSAEITVDRARAEEAQRVAHDAFALGQ